MVEQVGVEVGVDVVVAEAVGDGWVWRIAGEKEEGAGNDGGDRAVDTVFRSEGDY